MSERGPSGRAPEADRPPPRIGQEWLETDGLGGFAMGTALLMRTRRYHGLLTAAATPPTGRVMLVNGLDTWIGTPHGFFALSSQRYAPGVTHPDGTDRLESFSMDPWPTWTFRIPGGLRIVYEAFVRRGSPLLALSWRLQGRAPSASLAVRPLLSGRDIHSLHHANPAFRFDAEMSPGRVAWRPYPGIPGIAASTNGAYEHAPDWYRSFLYEEDAARGLDHVEDLASPGVFRFDLTAGEAVLLLSAEGIPGDAPPEAADVRKALGRLRAAERTRRAALRDPLAVAADAYIVRRAAGATIVAGYPWFTDWGRDTFIALRGLCIAGERLADARAILLEWAGRISEGMLPNRFPEIGEEPEYNSVDASLWYVVAVHDYLRAVRSGGPSHGDPRTGSRDRGRLIHAVLAILAGYARGTRFGIRMDEDGLLAAGAPGSGGVPRESGAPDARGAEDVALTWMDARVGGRAVTARVGKPVEVEALWVNALAIGAGLEAGWSGPHRRARAAFEARFWNEVEGCLYDVVDADGTRGATDASIRPNQVLAVGGLPFPVIEGERARRVVDVVESRLLTPLGLRTLAPGSPEYHPRYEGGVAERDAAYHQGTVWPWLMGPFVEAWVRVRRNTEEAKEEARVRFLDPLLAHRDDFGLGHLPEIADADPPHAMRGCPFQAWSVAEALRLDREVLATSRGTPRTRPS